VIALAGYIPQGFAALHEIPTRVMRFGGDGHGGAPLTLEVLAPTAEQIEALTSYLSVHRLQGIARLPVLDIVDAIDRAVHRLLDRKNGDRAEAEELLFRMTGYDCETIRLGLHDTLAGFRKPQLLRSLAQEFPALGVLDHFMPQPAGGYARAYGPALSTHVWAGNVPGLPAWSLLSSLLVKSPVIGKVASSEPYFAGWLARAIARENESLADSMAVIWWKGGDLQAEKAAFSASELVLAYGGMETIGKLRERVPPEVRCLTFGHKISFGCVTREALQVRQSEHVSAQAALDIARYDQQGCYSPQQFFVERGGRVEPRAFARQLAFALDNLGRTRPIRRLTVQESAGKAAYGSELVSEAETWTGRDGGWKVVYEEPQEPRLHASPLDRTIRITAVADIEQIAAAVAPYRAYLQTVGIAASPERLFTIGERLGDIGVTRLCAIGEMVRPAPGWHHDGRFLMQDLVRFVDIERTGEQEAERYADYRE
jgi:hypothetical protein